MSHSKVNVHEMLIFNIYLLFMLLSSIASFGRNYIEWLGLRCTILLFYYFR